MNSNPTVQALLFADDLVLWSADGDIRTTQASLNTALDAHLTWSNNNEMTVNTSKTVFQVFTLSHKSKAIQLFYGDYQLQRTQEVTYLGICFGFKAELEQASQQGTGHW
ncbi:hypothetical protein TNCT_537051 [Trichonephila clavata]|uniref:Reverse transcriptase domain-containing protein n=1 Tax=Trichonephila clavata TaxID=2740835 RepID=A0A8X6I432_TRICU|nr:hypothetical protein TNCT_537051 [Trichonephila clavata]